MFRDEEEWNSRPQSPSDKRIRTLMAKINFLMEMHDTLKCQYKVEYTRILRIVRDRSILSKEKIAKLQFFLERLNGFLSR